MTDDTRPDPLVPPEVDLRGYEYMPYYGDRLRDSDLNSRATDAEYRAAHNLWWAAWKQVPAASLPTDESTLCKLADLGRDVRTWRQVKERALHGFVECNDGRLYHRVLAEVALQSWAGRKEHQLRTLKARIAKLEKRLATVIHREERTHVESLLQDLRQQLSQAAKTSVTGGNCVSDRPPDAPVTGFQGRGREKDKGVNNNISTRVGKGQNLLKKIPDNPETDTVAVERNRRVAAALARGDAASAERIRSGLE